MPKSGQTRHGMWWERASLTGPFSDPWKRTQPTGNQVSDQILRMQPRWDNELALLALLYQIAAFIRAADTVLAWHIAIVRSRSMHMAAMASNRRGFDVSRACGILLDGASRDFL